MISPSLRLISARTWMTNQRLSPWTVVLVCVCVFAGTNQLSLPRSVTVEESQTDDRSIPSQDSGVGSRSWSNFDACTGLPTTEGKYAKTRGRPRRYGCCCSPMSCIVCPMCDTRTHIDCDLLEQISGSRTSSAFQKKANHIDRG